MQMPTGLYVVVDFETITPTGRSPEPIELAAIRFGVIASSRPDNEFCEFIKPPPGVGLTQFDIRQTGIVDRNLADARSAADILNQFDGFLTGTEILVAQNAKYEASIFSRLLPPTAKVNCLPFVDTIQLAKRILPGLTSYSLDSIATATRIEIPSSRHRAMVDVKLTRNVFESLVAIGIDTHLIANSEDIKRIANIRVRRSDQLNLF